MFLCDLFRYLLTTLLPLKFLKTNLINHILDIFILIEIQDRDLQKSLYFLLNPFCISFSCFPGLNLCTCLSVYTNKIKKKIFAPLSKSGLVQKERESVLKGKTAPKYIFLRTDAFSEEECHAEKQTRTWAKLSSL